MKDSERIEAVIAPAVEALTEFFQDMDPGDGEASKARIASSVLSTWAKLLQSERAQAGLYWNMAQTLARDPDELRRYIAVSMPDVPLLEEQEEAGSEKD